MVSLEHENIVKLVDFAETANNWHFFLEYCDSGYFIFY
jgi:hypothetical protein